MESALYFNTKTEDYKILIGKDQDDLDNQLEGLEDEMDTDDLHYMGTIEQHNELLLPLIADVIKKYKIKT